MSAESRALAKLRRIVGGTPDELSASDARALLALFDGGERPEPVGQISPTGLERLRDRRLPTVVHPEGDRRMADGLKLYASPVGRTPVSEGEARWASRDDGEARYCVDCGSGREGSGLAIASICDACSDVCCCGHSKPWHDESGRCRRCSCSSFLRTPTESREGEER